MLRYNSTYDTHSHPTDFMFPCGMFTPFPLSVATPYHGLRCWNLHHWKVKHTDMWRGVACSVFCKGWQEVIKERYRMHSQNKTCVLNRTLVNRTSLVYLQLKIAACYSLCILGSNVLSRSWNRFTCPFSHKGKCTLLFKWVAFRYKLPAYYFGAVFRFLYDCME
jgi:hypothetical protein